MLINDSDPLNEVIAYIDSDGRVYIIGDFDPSATYSTKFGEARDFDLSDDTPDASETFSNTYVYEAGTVSGTGGDDLIDGSYSGDPEGDAVDGGDNIGSGDPDDDIIDAGAGNDTVIAGAGNDIVDGGSGDDNISAGAGDDSVSGGDGDDTLDGGDGDDQLYGNGGDDVITVGVGDTAEGGGDADTFILDFAQTSTSGSATITIDGGTGEGLMADNDTLDLTGLGAFSLSETTDADGNSTSGTATYDSGQVVHFSEIEALVTCFTLGSLIQTDRGNVPVEDLVVGDHVATRDRGMQPIRWIGCHKLDAIHLHTAPKLRPIRIAAGAMGEGKPMQDLVLSPQHRVLLSSKIVERMFGDQEILVPVKKLLGTEGIEVVDAKDGCTYYHLLLEQHEVIYANGLPSESLYLGPQALKSITHETRAEIVTLFPEILQDRIIHAAARPFQANKRTLETLLARHKKNKLPLVSWHR